MNFYPNLTKFTPNDSLFWGVYIKRGPIFWILHQMTPFFLRNPSPNAPCFPGRQIPVTFTFECPLRHYIVGTRFNVGSIPGCRIKLIFSNENTPSVKITWPKIFGGIRNACGTSRGENAYDGAKLKKFVEITDFWHFPICRTYDRELSALLSKTLIVL